MKEMQTKSTEQFLHNAAFYLYLLFQKKGVNHQLNQIRYTNDFDNINKHKSTIYAMSYYSYSNSSQI